MVGFFRPHDIYVPTLARDDMGVFVMGSKRQSEIERVYRSMGLETEEKRIKFQRSINFPADFLEGPPPESKKPDIGKTETVGNTGRKKLGSHG